MAVLSSLSAADGGKVEKTRSKESVSSPAKRSKNPGVRVHGGRIYDPQNGTTCHQCRQKTMDFAASCKGTKREKPCPINFCHKCLLNRYGEKAEEVSALDVWSCPKCRGLCNCSFCMKKKGEVPTGILVHHAKLTGFSSVHELLNHATAPKKSPAPKAVQPTSSPKKSSAPKKGLGQTKRSRDKENCKVEENGAVIIGAHGVKEKSLFEEEQDKKPSKRLKQMTIGTECEKVEVKKKLQVKSPENGLPAQKDNDESLKGITMDKTMEKPPMSKGMPSSIIKEYIKEEVVRPQGKPLTLVAGVELPCKDVGPALQFLEFCNVFSKVFDIKKGEPEAIIRELVRGFRSQRRCRVTSAIIQFQIRLLSFILEDIGEESSLEAKGENSWLKALGKCLHEDKHFSMELPLDFVNDYSGYNNLNSSRKLRILLFLCDEVLGTEALRKFIDEENAKFAEEEKDRREHIIAAKKKERLVKQTLRDDFAKAMLSTQGDAQLSISEHENFISKLRFETEKAHQEMLQSIELLPKNPPPYSRIYHPASLFRFHAVGSILLQPDPAPNLQIQPQPSDSSRWPLPDRHLRHVIHQISSPQAALILL
ncbi:hypothetical protein KSP39_PZI023024 [Platanthera zijinensis]|uniref:DDT domain-containing protein n=1 Tax=Platanthera zijinensis TaxID=2320716 RepID=A0AAP0AVX2_9ASPA